MMMIIRTITCSLLLFFSLSAFPQSRWNDQFAVKTSFELGQSQTYAVSQFFKIDNILWSIKSEVNSLVNFQVIDTADGGYWIRYSINVFSVKQHNDSSAYVIAALLNGMEQFVYAKGGFLTLDSAFYFKSKKRVAEQLDSIATQRSFGKNTTQLIKHLQTELKEEAGLGALLAPLMLFEEYYSSGTYKKFFVQNRGSVVNILHKHLFDGNIGNKWEFTSKDTTLQLSRLFTGDPVPTARYFKPFYEAVLAANNIKRGRSFYPLEMRYLDEYTFRTRPGSSFPLYLHNRKLSEYIWRGVSKIVMREH
jgi:hypothetical protein